MISKNQKSESSSIDPNNRLDSVDPLIGIRDIAYLFYQWKKLTVSIMTSILMIAVIYSYSTPLIYRATAIATPPSDIQASLLNGLTNESYNGQELFRMFRMHIKSKAHHFDFFDEPDIRQLILASSPMEDVSDAARFFRERIAIDFDKDNRMTIHVHWTDPTTAEQLANRYLIFVERAATRHLLSDFLNGIEVRREILRQRIRKSREQGITSRQAEISRLEEAKKIAVKLGLVEFNPTTVAIPLYFRGSKALDAEIQILRNRTDDDSHNPSINSDIGMLQELGYVQEDTPWLKYIVTAVVEVDAHADQDHVEPIRYLIWLSGLGLGFLCSLFSVVLLHYIRAFRPRQTNT